MLKAVSLLKTFIPLSTSVRRYPFPQSFVQFLNNQSETQVSRIANGITVASEYRACCNACVGLFVDAGSRYEGPHDNGAAHFYEHIVFRSPKSQNLLEQMNTMGAKFRCFTTREMSVYYAECLSVNLPQVVEILSECVFNNSFNCTVIEAQKSVVYGEMLELDQDTNALVFDYLHATAFQGTSLGQTVMGPSTNITKWNQSILLNYVHKHFNPYRIVLAAVGPVTHDNLEMLANTFLCHIQGCFPKCVDVDEYRYTGSEIRFRNDALPAGNFAIALEAPCLCDEDKVVMDLAAAYLGGWDRSQYVGIDHGVDMARRASIGQICDAYEAFYITYKDTGLWGVQFMSNSLQAEDMLFNVQDSWMMMCTVMNEGELQRAKRELKTKLLYETESCVGACMDMGRFVLYNCSTRPPLVDRFREIDLVTVQEFKDVFTKYVYDKCPVIAAVGQTEGLPDYTRIRAHMYWLRY